MSQNWLDTIIDKVSKEKKEFDKSAFDTAILPSTVVGRQTEAEKIVRFLLDYKQGNVVPLVSIYGRSGSGKSTLIQHVCNRIPEIKLCFVNLRKAKTVFGGANMILNELDKPSLSSAQGMNIAMQQIQEEILSSLDTNTKLFVLALDEFDVLFYDKRGNPSDFVYKLVEMQTDLKKKGCLLIIFTISNNVLTDYQLDERIKSRIGNNEILFRPYQKDDILEILKIRAKDSKLNINSKVLEHCAKLSYLEHGDARRAVELLRVAVETATLEGKTVGTQHVDLASEKLQKDRVNDVLKTLSYHAKIACLVLAKKTYGLEEDWHSTSSLYDKYKGLVENKVSYRRFSELLVDLENSGLIYSNLTSRGKRGRRTEFRLEVEPEIVGNAVDSEWWDKNVVQRKKKEKLPFGGGMISRNDPAFQLYKKVQEDNKNYW